SAVWLYNVESGDRATLYEDYEFRIVSIARFDGEHVVVRDRRESQHTRFDLEGNVIAVEPTPSPNTRLQCEETSAGATVDGRAYDGVRCGLIGPDERWMLYGVDAGTQAVGGGTALPVWDQWAVNLDTDERRLLQAGLVHCGGCDGRFGPRWSPSGRFLVFPELVGNGRTFLHDFETAETRLLFEGSTEISWAPEWS